MNENKINFSRIGWKFDNTYTNLPKILLSITKPDLAPKPEISIFNYDLANQLGLDFSSLEKDEIANIFSGNTLPSEAQPISQAYGGHQFGFFSILGDGRAIILGEHIDPNNERYDIQFKGSGKTPYSRGGDGKATLGSMLREYLMSEAMHNLKIPTTRSLAVIKTGEDILRENYLKGSILTRIAKSHIRVGTFQLLSSKNDKSALNKLVNYTINRHFKEYANNKIPAVKLLHAVMERQIFLITNWMRVGFIHGVMNTDNMSINGETIDYGPCAFMNEYKANTFFSSIDHQGRYSYKNQPLIAHWNLSRFAETLIPLIDIDEKKAINLCKEIINKFSEKFKDKWLEMMRNKLGLIKRKNNDQKLINKLLNLMENNSLDFTNTFYDLSNDKILSNDLYKNIEFINWYKEWKFRLSNDEKSLNLSYETMKLNNPIFIPRNHIVEEALNSVVQYDDLSLFKKLLDILKDPYLDKKDANKYKEYKQGMNENYQTYCGT